MADKKKTAVRKRKRVDPPDLAGSLRGLLLMLDMMRQLVSTAQEQLDDLCPPESPPAGPVRRQARKPHR